MWRQAGTARVRDRLLQQTPALLPRRGHTEGLGRATTKLIWSSFWGKTTMITENRHFLQLPPTNRKWCSWQIRRQKSRSPVTPRRGGGSRQRVRTLGHSSQGQKSIVEGALSRQDSVSKQADGRVVSLVRSGGRAHCGWQTLPLLARMGAPGGHTGFLVPWTRRFLLETLFSTSCRFSVARCL